MQLFSTQTALNDDDEEDYSDGDDIEIEVKFFRLFFM